VWYFVKKWRRPFVISLVVLPTVSILWYYNLLPETWNIVNQLGLVGWGIYILYEWFANRKKPSDEEKLAKMATIIAEESQKLKEKREAIDKHTKVVYDEIVELVNRSSDFLYRLGHWLYCPDPDKFPEELSSHLSAYNALSIAITAKKQCGDYNIDLEKTTADTETDFISLVESKGFSLKCYGIVPHPDRYYSPDIMAWIIYQSTGNFEPYTIEPAQGRQGWFQTKAGANTIAQTDDKVELESFTKLANDYSLGKIEVFKKFHERRQKAWGEVKGFFDALSEIKKKLDSGHLLKGKCHLCPDSR
jgi:hypothetical protein